MASDRFDCSTAQVPIGENSGEVSGAFLYGFTQAFYNLSILPEGELKLGVSTLDPEKWYPYDLLIDTMERIEKAFPASGSIFFRAGMFFLNFWYAHGPGKSMIFSGMDWLNANRESGGYNSVVRGGAPEQIGWCLLKYLDEDAGIAVYENVMPISPDFIAGVFYAGCMLFGDMDFVKIDSRVDSFDLNPAFNRIITTVYFKLSPPEVGSNLDERIDNLDSQGCKNFTPSEIQSLIWRYKNVRQYDRVLGQYFNDINSILAASIEQLQITQQNLIRSEKMAALGALVAGVAHEINTPVGLGLTGASHFKHMVEQLELKFDNEQLTEPEFKSFLADSKELARAIFVSLERAASLVGSFKLVAVDQAHDELRQFRPRKYIEDVILTHQQVLKSAKVTLTVACDETLEALSYAGAWSQILSNLITNSIVHGLTPEQTDGQIWISVSESENELVLAYQDNGKGMSEEVAKKVYDPFFTTNRQAGGSGLGMHIVYNLVSQKLHGYIQLETAPGQGVKFSIRLPKMIESQSD